MIVHQLSATNQPSTMEATAATTATATATAIDGGEWIAAKETDRDTETVETAETTEDDWVNWPSKLMNQFDEEQTSFIWQVTRFVKTPAGQVVGETGFTGKTGFIRVTKTGNWFAYFDDTEGADPFLAYNKAQDRVYCNDGNITHTLTNNVKESSVVPTHAITSKKDGVSLSITFTEGRGGSFTEGRGGSFKLFRAENGRKYTQYATGWFLPVVGKKNTYHFIFQEETAAGWKHTGDYAQVEMSLVGGVISLNSYKPITRAEIPSFSATGKGETAPRRMVTLNDYIDAALESAGVGGGGGGAGAGGSVGADLESFPSLVTVTHEDTTGRPAPTTAKKGWATAAKASAVETASPALPRAPLTTPVTQRTKPVKPDAPARVARPASATEPRFVVAVARPDKAEREAEIEELQHRLLENFEAERKIREAERQIMIAQLAALASK